MNKQIKHKEFFSDFSIWLNEHKKFDSKVAGYVTTDIDHLWHNYKKKKYMALEEKCYLDQPNWSQRQTLLMNNENVRAGKPSNYFGIHLVQFENKSPTDGDIWLDGRKVTLAQFEDFLDFKAPLDWYEDSDLVGVNRGEVYSNLNSSDEIEKFINGL